MPFKGRDTMCVVGWLVVFFFVQNEGEINTQRDTLNPSESLDIDTYSLYTDRHKQNETHEGHTQFQVSHHRTQ